MNAAARERPALTERDYRGADAAHRAAATPERPEAHASATGRIEIDRGHACPVPGCLVRNVPDEMLMCVVHLKATPKRFLDEAERAWTAWVESRGMDVAKRFTLLRRFHVASTFAVSAAVRAENDPVFARSK
jgi:hypothetical protein